MRTERCQPCSLIVALADSAEGDPISRLHGREEVLLTLFILRSWWSSDGHEGSRKGGEAMAEGGSGRLRYSLFLRKHLRVHDMSWPGEGRTCSRCRGSQS